MTNITIFAKKRVQFPAKLAEQEFYFSFWQY